MGLFKETAIEPNNLNALMHRDSESSYPVLSSIFLTGNPTKSAPVVVCSTLAAHFFVYAFITLGRGRSSIHTADARVTLILQTSAISPIHFELPWLDVKLRDNK